MHALIQGSDPLLRILFRPSDVRALNREFGMRAAYDGLVVIDQDSLDPRRSHVDA